MDTKELAITPQPMSLLQCEQHLDSTYCIRIRTRGGIYGKIGLSSYFTVYPDLSPNMDIIPFLTMIYCNCIVTRGGVYDEILPEPEGFPEAFSLNGFGHHDEMFTSGWQLLCTALEPRRGEALLR